MGRPCPFGRRLQCRTGGAGGCRDRQFLFLGGSFSIQLRISFINVGDPVIAGTARTTTVPCRRRRRHGVLLLVGRIVPFLHCSTGRRVGTCCCCCCCRGSGGEGRPIPILHGVQQKSEQPGLISRQCCCSSIHGSGTVRFTTRRKQGVGKAVGIVSPTVTKFQKVIMIIVFDIVVIVVP